MPIYPDPQNCNSPLLSETASKTRPQVAPTSNRRPLTFSNCRQHAIDKPDELLSVWKDTAKSGAGCNHQHLQDAQPTTSSGYSSFTPPSSTTTITWGPASYNDDTQTDSNISGVGEQELLESATSKRRASLRRSSLVKTLSLVTDFVSTAADIATSSDKEPSIEQFLEKQVIRKQSSGDYVKDSELNQRIAAVTLDLLSYYRNQDLCMATASNPIESNSFFTIMKTFVSKGIGRIGFWIIVSALAVLTFKDVSALVKDYSADPKTSDMNIVFNESMTMPNITFCMSRSQAWSHMAINPNESTEDWDARIVETLESMPTKQAFLNATWDYRMIMESYDVVATLNSMERETTPDGAMRAIFVFEKLPRLATKREMVKKWLTVLKDRGITFDEFTQKVGSETIKQSLQRFQRTTYDENLIVQTKFRTSWISMMQFCFQPWFDEDNFHPIKDQGNFFVMLLAHNSTKLAGQQVECMSIDFHGRPSSLSRFMEGSGRIKDGFNDELCPGMVHEVTVEVRAQYVMLENNATGTACNSAKPGQDTEFDCRSRCRMEMLRQLCNCTALTLSYLATPKELETWPLCDYTQCVVDVQNPSNLTDETCSSKCHRDCNQIRYETDHATKGRSVRPDLTSITLKYGRFDYTLITEKNNISAPELGQLRIPDNGTAPNLVDSDIHRRARRFDRNVARPKHSESASRSDVPILRGEGV
uniref:EF-hand domain-containing protein n=1 Tax=Panagrellus redivivus TaxID=6233 RepID=A0A7E4VY83_PANRE